jgi:aminoglycoside N3'-acetyltransferase
MSKLLPNKFVKTEKSIRSKIRGARQRITKGKVDKAQIVKDLKGIGIKEGDNILVHSSLKSIGFVEGGADTVIDALTDALSCDGTLAMPSFSICRTNLMLGTLESNTIFNPMETPSTVGRITEIFRQKKGVFRSIHPTHSICAFGAKARWITEGHDKCGTTFGKGSPFYKIMELDGKILGLGVDLGRITFCHVIEDVFDNYPVPVYLDKEYKSKVIDRDGVERVIKIKCHNPEIAKTRMDKKESAWIREFFTRYLTSKGLLKKGYIGEARSLVIRAIDLFEAQKKLLEDNITHYTTEGEYLRRKIREND